MTDAGSSEAPGKGNQGNQGSQGNQGDFQKGNQGSQGDPDLLRSREPGAGSREPSSLLGPWLRKAREAARRSLRECALALDYSAAYLSDIERGQRRVTRDLCELLSSELRLDRIELYARAGHLPGEVMEYLQRTPQALRVLVLLSRQDASSERVQALCASLLPERRGGREASGAEDSPEARRPPASGAEARADAEARRPPASGAEARSSSDSGREPEASAPPSLPRRNQGID